MSSQSTREMIRAVLDHQRQAELATATVGPIPTVTPQERELLDKIAVRYQDSAMPPGIKRTAVRPSSAGAKIQTHPSFATSLFANNDDRNNSHRPNTAVGLARPKTQAGGPRQWARAPAPKTEEIVKPHRRLTVGPVDGLAETDFSRRTAVGQPQLGALFRGKVSQWTFILL